MTTCLYDPLESLPSSAHHNLSQEGPALDICPIQRVTHLEQSPGNLPGVGGRGLQLREEHMFSDHN